jgi:uncharacterized protein
VKVPSDLPPRRTSRRSSRRIGNRGRIALIVVFALLLILFLSARGLANFYVDTLWYRSVDQSDVYWSIIRTKLLLALVFSAGFAIVLWASLVVADRLAPLVRVDGPEEQVLERYREFVGNRQGLVRVATAVVFGLIAGLPTSGRWQEWMMFRNAVSFGVRDDQFDTDVGFYVFRLPFLSFLVGWLFATVVIITLLTAVAHYLNGGIRLQTGGRHVTPQVKLHLSALLAILALLKAADYWLQRYGLTTSRRGYVEGATYTDVNAQLPALQLLILISILAAVLFLVNVRQKGFRLPIMAVGLWSVVALVAGTIYPTVVQRFQVEPSESTREAPYIERNIEATRAAMNLDEVDVRPITIGAVSASDVEASVDAIADTRLLDPSIIGNTYQLDEGRRSGYKIGDLDVDRYVLDGRLQQVVLATRELDTAGAPIRTWEGRHLAYTHGYGVAFAPASRVDADGKPLYVAVVSPENGLGLTRPEIYFGDGMSGYAVVDTNRTGGEETLDPARPRYAGDGGVQLSSRLRRAAFWLHFGEYNLFGSRLVSDESRVIYNRDVRTRVEKLAPFLHLDADPYPVVSEGRLVWVVDAYTTTDRYPNAERADTRQLPAQSGLRHSFNYVRNSVKATVDAYDGTVRLYVVDPSDPIVAAWQKTFPSLFSSADEVPESIRTHFRYPEDLFRVQTNAYGRYQLLDAEAFYSQQLAWSVAQDAPSRQADAIAATTPGVTTTVPASGRVNDSDSARFDPYYTIFHAPVEGAEPEFVLFRPFVPFSRNDERKQLQAYMTASSDPATYGKLTAYVLPEPLPDGPLTVASNINQRFSRELTLIDQAGSEVRFGDLQIVPVGAGLIYVRPWFVQAVSSPIPVLDSVSVTYSGRSEVGTSLSDAIGKLFAVDVDLGDRQQDPDGSGGTPTPDPGDPGTEPVTVEELLADAERLFDEAQAAKLAFDSKTYEEKIEQAYERVRQAAELATGGDVTIDSTAPEAPTESTVDT